jgi:hypothetical protein
MAFSKVSALIFSRPSPSMAGARKSCVPRAGKWRVPVRPPHLGIAVLFCGLSATAHASPNFSSLRQLRGLAVQCIAAGNCDQYVDGQSTCCGSTISGDSNCEAPGQFAKICCLSNRIDYKGDGASCLSQQCCIDDCINGVCCSRTGGGCNNNCVGDSNQGTATHGCAATTCCDPGATCFTDRYDAGICCRPEFSTGCMSDSECCGTPAKAGKCVIAAGAETGECRIPCTKDTNCATTTTSSPPYGCPEETYCCNYGYASPGAHPGVGGTDQTVQGVETAACGGDQDCCTPETGATCNSGKCCVPLGAPCPQSWAADACCGWAADWHTSSAACFAQQGLGLPYCEQCTPVGQQPIGNNWDAGSACCSHKSQFVHGNTNNPQECCVDVGWPCTATTDCCGGDVTLPNLPTLICGPGVCCKELTVACQSSAQCCSGWCNPASLKCDGETTPCQPKP